MVLEIKKLMLKNYAGFEALEVDFTKKKNIISGKNGLGKTTIANAIFSTLFMGKNIDGTKATRHRPHDKYGQDKNTEPVVSCVYIAIDGTTHVITRKEEQKWVKHRGSLEPQFEGNTTSYIVDDLCVSETQYKKWLDSQNLNEKDFRAVTSAKDLLNLRVEDRRSKLIQMFGDLDISDYDIAERNPKYNQLVDHLKVYTIDETIANHKQAIKSCEAVLRDMPDRINERKAMLVDIDVTELNKRKDEIEADLSQLENEKSKILNSGSNVSRMKLAQLELDKGKLETKLEKEFCQDKMEKQHVIMEAKNKLANIKEACEIAKTKYHALTDKKELLTKELDKVKIEYKELATKKIDDSLLMCPCCGRKLEGPKLEEVREKLAKELAEKTAEVKSKGDELFNTIMGIKDEMAMVVENAKSLQAELTAASENVDKLSVEIKDNSTVEDYISKSSEYKAIEEEINSCKANIPTDNKSLDTGLYDSKISELKDELNGVLLKLNQVAYNEQNQAMIDSYEQRISEARVRGAEIQKIIDLAEDFKREKIKAVCDKINSHFKVVKWKMFETQVNGGIADICTPIVNGSILGSDLNTGMGVIAEIDICNAFQEKLGLKAPIIVDNAEQLDSDSIAKINADTQLIMLRVSDDNKLIFN